MTPASPSLVSVSDGGLVATGSGYEALLAYSGTVVDDFVFIRIAAIDHLVPSVTAFTLDENIPQTLSVQPADPAGNILAGQLPCTWSVTTGSNVIDLTIGSASTSVQLQGVTDGTATVHAVCGAASVDVNVKVGVRRLRPARLCHDLRRTHRLLEPRGLLLGHGEVRVALVRDGGKPRVPVRPDERKIFGPRRLDPLEQAADRALQDVSHFGAQAIDCE